MTAPRWKGKLTGISAGGEPDPSHMVGFILAIMFGTLALLAVGAC